MKQIKAIEAFQTPYMTQSAEVEFESRLFVTAISGISISEEDWRGATVEEKAEWQAEMDKLMPIEASETNLAE
jgi:hypothetical protein